MPFHREYSQAPSCILAQAGASMHEAARGYAPRRPTLLFLEEIDEGLVGLMDERTVQRGQVDERGLVVVVAKAFADDGQRDVQGPGGGGPGVAGHIGGERHGKAYQPAQLLQVAVDALLGLLELASVGAIGRPKDDGQQVGTAGTGGRIAVDQGLHLGGPLDANALVGLPTDVDQHAAAQVGLAQVGHVDKRHAASVEAEQEQVARTGLRRTGRQLQAAEGPHLLGRDGTVGGPAVGGMDAGKRLSRGGNAFGQSPIVDRTEGAQVERNGVAAQAGIQQMGLIPLQQRRREGLERHVLALEEPTEAAHRAAIGLGRAFTLHPDQPINLLLHVIEYRVFAAGCAQRRYRNTNP